MGTGGVVSGEKGREGGGRERGGREREREWAGGGGGKNKNNVFIAQVIRRLQCKPILKCKTFVSVRENFIPQRL